MHLFGFVRAAAGRLGKADLQVQNVPHRTLRTAIHDINNMILETVVEG
jgi:hypothetical protein